MRKTPLVLWLFVLPIVVFAAVSATAQTLPLNLELELGYRWTDIQGNDALYRSQINERAGVVLRSLSYFTADVGGATDHFRVDAYDLGTSPAGSLRIDTGKSGLYRVRFGYRTFDSFRALPAVANPFLAQGIIPGQHTFDRNRKLFDADVEWLGFRSITPFAGYSWGNNEGPGTTTYTLGGDEFHLGSDLEERDRELRVGASFNTAKFTGTFTQGWRRLSTRETLVLIPGTTAGNNAGSILGREITAGDLTRSSKTDVDAPFTNFHVVASLIPRTKLIGTFVRVAADAASDESESATGSFVSFDLGRFFGGVSETMTSDADNRTWRAGLRSEMALTGTVTLLAGYEAESREVGGTALINTLFRDTITFGGLTAGNVQEILDAESALNRDENTFSAGISARSVGPFAVRIAFRQTEQEYEIAPDLAEIVVPGNQGSKHSRSIKTFEMSGTYARPLLTLGASIRMDDASTQILRTDFADRTRYRVRAAFNTPKKMIRIAFTGEKGTQNNLRDELGFEADTRLYTADAEFVPADYIRFRGSYSRIAADSRISVRRPETFAIETSFHDEKGESIEGGVAFLFAPFTVDASISRFANEGTLPFDFERYRVRATYDFTAKAGLAAEWTTDEYDEQAVFGKYDANRYGVFLRLRP